MSTARYSLNLYDRETMEVAETVESNGLLWGDYVDIVEDSQQLQGKDDAETLMLNFDFVERTMLRIFPTLTREGLRMASADEMIYTMRQVLALGQKFAKGKAKN